MLNDLLVNICILITFIFVWHQVFRKMPLTSQSPLWIKTADGAIAGLLGIILMHYSIVINDITILDLRHVPVAIVAFYGGVFPPLVAAFVITVGRYAIDINFSSHVAMFMMLFIAIGVGLIAKYMMIGAWKKWFIMLIYAQAIFSLAFYVVSSDYSLVFGTALLHVLITLIGGTLAFYFVRYIKRNSELFFQYRDFSRKDPLTGLYNVRAFHHFYESFLANAKIKGTPFVLLLLDIDHFKQVNDQYGHIAGDEILKQLSSLIEEIAGPEAVVARNGGEEFSVMYTGMEFSDVEMIAESIRLQVEQHEFTLPNETHLSITVSIGVAQYQSDFQEDFELYKYADHALYQAKETGRNQTIRLLEEMELHVPQYETIEYK